jgi:hypothetical protein
MKCKKQFLAVLFSQSSLLEIISWAWYSHHRHDIFFPLRYCGWVVTLLIRTVEVPVSYLDLENGYGDGGFRGFPKYLRENVGMVT